jgi:hypothetical protein
VQRGKYTEKRGEQVKGVLANQKAEKEGEHKATKGEGQYQRVKVKIEAICP